MLSRSSHVTSGALSAISAATSWFPRSAAHFSTISWISEKYKIRKRDSNPYFNPGSYKTCCDMSWQLSYRILLILWYQDHAHKINHHWMEPFSFDLKIQIFVFQAPVSIFPIFLLAESDFEGLIVRLGRKNAYLCFQNGITNSISRWERHLGEINLKTHLSQSDMIGYILNCLFRVFLKFSNGRPDWLFPVWNNLSMATPMLVADVGGDICWQQF